MDQSPHRRPVNWTALQALENLSPPSPSPSGSLDALVTLASSGEIPIFLHSSCEQLKSRPTHHIRFDRPIDSTSYGFAHHPTHGRVDDIIFLGEVTLHLALYSIIGRYTFKKHLSDFALNESA